MHVISRKPTASGQLILAGVPIATTAVHTPLSPVSVSGAMSGPACAKAMPTEELQYVQYHGSKEESYLPAIRQLISKDLSEPYSIYVYRYFLYQWGDLCYMVCSASEP